MPFFNLQITSMERYQSLKKHIIARLEKELRPALYYHGVHHVLDVLNAAENIAQTEHVDEINLELLKVAVLFHDSGFIFDSVDHEKRSCGIAQETLPTFGYDATEIEKIGMGGLSGLPILEKSTALVKYIHEKTEGKLFIIGSGGIFTPQHAASKIKAGASLVQVWTGFIFEGPAIVKNIIKGIKK